MCTSCTHAGLDTLLGGGTAILDHIFTRDIEDVAAAVAAYRALGIRCFLALMLGDTADETPLGSFSNYIACCNNAPQRNAAASCGCGGLGPGGLLREVPNSFDPAKTEAAAALWEEAVLRFHKPEEGINIAVGPQSCYAASTELFRRAAELRRKYGLCGHTHLLETRSQALQSRQYFGAEGAVGMLKSTGFLELPGTTLAHSVWLDDSDIAAVAAAGATIVHNPLSNLRLGSGVAPIHKYLAAGVNIALGCDGAASSDGQNMLEVMKVSSTLHTLSTPEYRSWPEPKAVVAWATAGGYAGVDMAGRAGVIAVGAQADVCLYDLTALSMLPRTDPVGMLVLGNHTSGGGPLGSALQHCWVRGRRVISDGMPATCDVKALRSALAGAYRHVRGQASTDPRAHPQTAAAEVEYRAATGLDGTMRRGAAHAAADAALLDGYASSRVLDERTSFP